MESVISFSSLRGDTLRGIMSSPEGHAFNGSKHLVIFPNCGLVGCEGDYRSYVSITRRFTRAGYFVMRFSPTGFGYSDGEIPDCRTKTLFNQLENGMVVRDIKAAVKFATSIDTFASITLSGICGGAISSFLAAAELREVDYVVPMSIPVILDRDDLDYNARLPADEAKLKLKLYYDKVITPKAWARLFLGKSDIQAIKAALFALFQKKTSYMSEDPENSKFTPNPLFFDAAEKLFKARKKVLFVFGDTDGFWWEFQNLFLKKHYNGIEHAPFDLYLAPRANHMLNFPEMQHQVSEAILTWMSKYHGSSLRHETLPSAT
jgi:hypothetical protein